MVDKDTLKYKCGYCGREFTQDVGKYDTGGKHSVESDKVQCRCGNFLKTWKD